MLHKVVSSFRSISFLPQLLVVIWLVGCAGDTVPSLADINNTNIKKLRSAYNLFLIRHNLSGPKDEEELKNYLKNDPGAKVKMKRMEISPDQVDSIFISERDGKPFKVRYGLKGLSDHAVVFETEGIDGMRLVAFNTPKELNKKEYDVAWEGVSKQDDNMDVLLPTVQ